MNNNLHVLLIEPIPILLIAIKLNMERLGCVVDTASDESTGVEKALNNQYDLILIEIGEERQLDGFTVVEQIKQRCLLNQKTPLVALTVHPNKHGHKERATLLGVNYFEGPFIAEIAQRVYDYAIQKKGS